jgi:hypothetical protein
MSFLSGWSTFDPTIPLCYQRFTRMSHTAGQVSRVRSLITVLRKRFIHLVSQANEARKTSGPLRTSRTTDAGFVERLRTQAPVHGWRPLQCCSYRLDTSRVCPTYRTKRVVGSISPYTNASIIASALLPYTIYNVRHKSLILKPATKNQQLSKTRTTRIDMFCVLVRLDYPPSW